MRCGLLYFGAVYLILSTWSSYLRVSPKMFEGWIIGGLRVLVCLVAEVLLRRVVVLVLIRRCIAEPQKPLAYRCDIGRATAVRVVPLIGFWRQGIFAPFVAVTVVPHSLIV